ncbi:MAG: septum formation initiator family protein [Cyanobacteriota bacterium]
MSTVRVYNYQVEQIRETNNTTVSKRFLEKQEQLKKQEKLNSLIINSLLISVAVFLSFQFIRGTYLNFDRYVTLNDKMSSLKALNINATYENDVLKKKYKSYNSPEGLEGLARDYLNLVGENEISVVLKKS